MTVRTRFAPSPTGELHLGGLRTALYAFLWARHHGPDGSFSIRIEDTDRERLAPGSDERILASLRQLGITWDEGPDIGGPYGPYVQSQRLEQYRSASTDLVGQGSAYRCDCSPQRLTELRERQTAARQPTRYDGRCRTRTDIDASAPHVIRFRMGEGSVTVSDIIHGAVTVDRATLDDFVLMKSDGYPTYHLAHVVDDHAMQTTHVIRGDEWLPSLPKHVLLFRAFGWEPPQYAHLPLLLNAQRKKLSKRDGDVAVESFLAWCLPEALLNFIALLGWNPTSDRERYTCAELIATFDLTKVNRSPAIVDFRKLEWLNGAYVRSRSPAEMLDALTVTGAIPADRAAADRTLLLRAVALEQTRMARLDTFPAWYVTAPAREAPLPWKQTSTPETLRRLELLHAKLMAIDDADWPHDLTDIPRLEADVKTWIAREGLGVGETLWPMRVALSGQRASPSPFELAWCFGKDETLRRIDHAMATL